MHPCYVALRPHHVPIDMSSCDGDAPLAFLTVCCCSSSPPDQFVQVVEALLCDQGRLSAVLHGKGRQAVPDGRLLQYPPQGLDEARRVGRWARLAVSLQPFLILQGAIPLGGCSVDAYEEPTQPFALRITHPDFGHYEVFLGAESKASREDWVGTGWGWGWGWSRAWVISSYATYPPLHGQSTNRSSGSIRRPECAFPSVSPLITNSFPPTTTSSSPTIRTFKGAQQGDSLVAMLQAKGTELERLRKEAQTRLEAEMEELEQEREERDKFEAMAAMLQEEKEQAQREAQQLGADHSTALAQLEKTSQSVAAMEAKLAAKSKELAETTARVEQQQGLSSQQQAEIRANTQRLQEEQRTLSSQTQNMRDSLMVGGGGGGDCQPKRVSILIIIFSPFISPFR